LLEIASVLTFLSIGFPAELALFGTGAWLDAPREASAVWVPWPFVEASLDVAPHLPSAVPGRWTPRVSKTSFDLHAAVPVLGAWAAPGRLLLFGGGLGHPFLSLGAAKIADLLGD